MQNKSLFIFISEMPPIFSRSEKLKQNERKTKIYAYICRRNSKFEQKLWQD